MICPMRTLTSIAINNVLMRVGKRRSWQLGGGGQGGLAVAAKRERGANENHDQSLH